MDVSEILRLAGADENAETFQVALEGKPRPGSMLALQRAPSASPHVLAEKRGYNDLKQMYSPGVDRLYGRLGVAVDALGEVIGVVGDVWKCLDRMHFGEDPDSGIGEAAARIQGGPLADIEKLAKGAGFALDKYIDRRGEHETTGKNLAMGYGGDSLDVACLHLRGEVAEALAILKVVAPSLETASPRDLPSIDADLWKKAGPAFIKGVEGRVDVLCAAVEKLLAKRDETAVESRATAADRALLAHGAELAEAVFALPPERQEWGTGLSEGANDKGALRLVLPLTPNYDRNEVYAFVKVLNAKLVKDKKLSAGATGKYDATQVTDVDLTSGSATLWFAMAPEAKADKAHAKLLGDLVADAVLGYENADILFHWDGDEERPAKGTYAARELDIDIIESVEQMHADLREGASQAWRIGTVFHVPGGEFSEPMWVLPFEATKNGAATKVHLVKWPAGKKKPTIKQAGGWDDRAFNSNNAKAVEIKDTPAEVLALLKATGALKSTAPATESARAVFVTKITIPASKPSVASDDADAWASEESKMAADFELVMERGPIKSSKAPKAMVKVTKVGFEGTGAKYSLRATVEVSGEGVSSLDDDLITALDKRAEAALDAVVQNGEQAAEVAFGDLRWNNTTIEVM